MDSGCGKVEKKIGIFTKFIKIMKKTFTIFACLMLVGLFTAKSQALLQEGFEGEDVPAGWTLIDNDGDGANWYVLNDSQSQSGGFVNHSGAGHITSASWASSPLTPDNWLITPALNLTGPAVLSFWVAGQDPSYASENFSVLLSTTGTNVADFTHPLLQNQTSTPEMTQFTANLSQFAGQTVYIAFRHHDISDMFRINLDDVAVTASGTGVNEYETVANVYPNPATDVVNVNTNAALQHIEIVSMNGQKVLDEQAEGFKATVNTSTLAKGVYMMNVYTENGVSHNKLTVVR